MAKALEMNADFARWYAESFMEEGQIRAARWKGVISTAAAADFHAVEVLVRYAFATAAPASGGKNEILNERHRNVLASISGNASPLNPETSRRELQVLCAATLAQMFPTRPDAAIVVLNASFGGMRKAELPMDLPALAKIALVALSKRKHARPDAKVLEIASPKFEFEVSPEAMESLSAEHWGLELNRLRDASQAATRAIVNEQNRVAKLLARQICLGEEELQMLWWLIGSHSCVANASFADVSIPLKPLAFAWELGKLTEVSPGPASLIALLSRAGVSHEELRVSDAVNAAPVDWIRDITTSSRISPVTTPLLFALEKRVEAGSDDAWLPFWVSMTGLPAEATMSGVKLAELFYREYLFLHVDA